MSLQDTFQMARAVVSLKWPIWRGLTITMLSALFITASTAFALGENPSREQMAEEAQRAKDLNKAVRNGDFFVLGANGELVRIRYSDGLSHSLDFGGPIVGVFSNLGGLTLTYYRFGPWARIDSDGTVKILPSASSIEIKGFTPTLFPSHWSHLDKEGKVTLPKEGTVVVSPGALDKRRKAPRVKPPKNAKWFILCAEDCLLTPEHDTQRPKNVLWAVPFPDGRYQLIHSGPIRSGVYLTINPNRTIEYGEGAENYQELNKVRHYWPYVTYVATGNSDIPTIETPGGFLVGPPRSLEGDRPIEVWNGFGRRTPPILKPIP